MSSPGREANGNDSRRSAARRRSAGGPSGDRGTGSPPGRARGADLARVLLVGCGLAGALALLAATFTDVVVVRAGSVSGGDSGFDRHGPALILLALAACGLVVLILRGARAACPALLAVGLTAIVLAVAGDVPDIGTEGAYGTLYPSATTAAGVGFFLETLGGVLVLLCGGGLWALGPPARDAYAGAADGD